MNDPVQLQLVYRSNSGKECRRRSTVLSAAGVNHHLHQQASEFALLVLPQDVDRALAELNDYAIENPKDVKPAPAVLRNDSGWFGVAGYAIVLIAVELLQRTEQFGFDWFHSGMTSAGLIKNGEWWRAVTALTLHTDLPHLVSNLVIGGLFGLFVGKHLGSGLGCLAILVAGAAGNVVNAMLHHSSHTSVGASTGVFAALGILAGATWRLRKHSPGRFLARWSPLIGGAILLGYLGTAGERTDVGAHIAGFAAGLVLGAILTRFGTNLANTNKSQLLLASTALAIIVLAWTLALTQG